LTAHQTMNISAISGTSPDNIIHRNIEVMPAPILC
jgi:hypothetical protein